MGIVTGRGWILCLCSTLPLACQPLGQAVGRAVNQTPDATPIAAAQLASRIASLLPRGTTVSIETRNLARLPPPEWSKFPSRLEDELRKAGLQISGLPAAAGPTATTPPEARVRVTLADDAQGLLLVAEVFTGPGGDNRQVAMVPWNVAPATQPNPRVSITKSPLWTQESPILDVLLADSNSEILVLGVNSIASYRLMDGKWSAVSSASLALPRPMPRDPRGRLEETPGGFRAYLPVGTCEGTLAPELKVACAPGTAAWQSAPVRWVADRNVLEPYPPAPPIEGVGSDAAGIADPCGGDTLTIADSPDSEQDSIRVYQLAAPASEALALPGPVTALWPLAAGREAILVVHNLQTGEYEASRLGVACSQ
jgi:hypothetical protein